MCHVCGFICYLCMQLKLKINTRSLSNQVSHYGDVIMGPIASQITSPTIVYSTVYSDADQRKHQSSASLAFVRGIHRGPVNSPHKWPVTRKMFPFDDVIMGVSALITAQFPLLALRGSFQLMTAEPRPRYSALQLLGESGTYGWKWKSSVVQLSPQTKYMYLG